MGKIIENSYLGFTHCKRTVNKLSRILEVFADTSHPQKLPKAEVLSLYFTAALRPIQQCLNDFLLTPLGEDSQTLPPDRSRQYAIALSYSFHKLCSAHR